MIDRIPESDWKLLRELHSIALDRFCQRVMSQVGRLAKDAGTGAHDRYLAAFDLIERANRDLSNVFNDLRRSNAILRLVSMRSDHLITDEEFGRFTLATRQAVNSLIAVRST
jgi:hypothetical protein